MLKIRKLKEVAREYNNLTNHDHDPKKRGRKFNNLIANLFQAWGIQAEANVHGEDNDEIDVCFELDNKHFILEAKWENRPINNDPIAKLKNNLERRLENTFGIIISMSGYTKPAITKLKQSALKNVFLLNKEHLEAMITGFIAPEEMIRQIIKLASTKGNFYALNIADLYGNSGTSIYFGKESSTNLIKSSSTPKFFAKTVLSNLPHSASGITNKNDKLLLTHPAGIIEINFEPKRTKNILPIPKCHQSVLAVEDDNIYVIRNYGIAKTKNKKVAMIAGGYLGNICCLLEGPSQTAWAFASGYSNGTNIAQPALIQLGNNVGSEIIYPVDYPLCTAHSAIFVCNDKFLIAGNQGIALFQLKKNLCQRIKNITSPTDTPSNPTGLIKIKENIFLLAHGGHNSSICLSELNIDTDSIKPVAQLNLSGTPPILSNCKNYGGYMLTKYSEQTTDKIIVQWSYI